MKTELGFSSEPESAAGARRAVTRAVEAWGAEVDVDVLRLATSDVMTNAIRHGQPPIRLSIEWTDRELTVGVSDGNPDGVAVATIDAAVSAESGRGHHLLSQLTLAWGVHRHPATKTVWFTLPVAVPAAVEPEARSERSHGPQRLHSDPSPRSDR